VEKPSASVSGSRSKFLKSTSDLSRPLSAVDAAIVVEVVAVEMGLAAKAMDLSEGLVATESTVVAVVMDLGGVDVAMLLAETLALVPSTVELLLTLMTPTLSQVLDHN
jgi:hypothetical protein